LLDTALLEIALLKSDPEPLLSADEAIDIVKAEFEAQGKPYVITPEDLKLFGGGKRQIGDQEEHFISA
jgi:hypothetical protein